MVGTSLAMAPAMLLTPQDARFVDLDGPLLLARDRVEALRTKAVSFSPPDPACGADASAAILIRRRPIWATKRVDRGCCSHDAMHREALLLSPQEPTSSLSPQDFDAIEAAVMETSRGRWFLTEYARRNRHADTEKLLEAIGRLETTVEASGPVRDPGGDLMRFRREIADMAETVSLAKQEIASSVMEDTGERRGPGTQERAYEDLIRTAEKADQDVFNAAEHVQEIAWAMRETGEIGSSCDDLDRHALEIYRASNQHALTTNRVRSIIGVLRFIEARIEALMGAYPSELVLLGNERPDAPHGVSTATLLDSRAAAHPR